MRITRTRTRRPTRRPRAAARSAAGRLREAEALFSDFASLTPFAYRPFVKMFDSFDDYERWRRAQKNPWYR